MRLPASTVAVPTAGFGSAPAAATGTTTDRLASSTSLSLPSTLSVTWAALGSSNSSLAATGASLTGTTLTVTVALRRLLAASTASTVKVSVPERLALGRYVNDPLAEKELR